MITAALKLPTLFYFGVDGAFGAFTTLITFFVFLLSRKMWEVSKGKRYKYFSWVFGGLTLSFLARTLTNLILFFKYDEVILNPASRSLFDFSNVFLVGYTFHIITGLAFYLLLLFISLNAEKWKLYAASLSLLIVGLYLSRSYFTAFYAFSFVILLFVAHQYFGNFKLHKTFASFSVFSVFLCLMLAQAGFFLHIYGAIFYLLGYVFQVIGIFALLVALIKVIKHE